MKGISTLRTDKHSHKLLSIFFKSDERGAEENADY